VLWIVILSYFAVFLKEHVVYSKIIIFCVHIDIL